MRKTEDLGLKIVLARKAAKMTQADLAKKIGKSRQTVHTWKHNLFVPDIEDLKKISKVTHAPLNYFIDNSISINTGDTIITNTGKNSIVGKNQKVSYTSKETDLLNRELVFLREENAFLKEQLKAYKPLGKRK